VPGGGAAVAAAPAGDVLGGVGRAREAVAWGGERGAYCKNRGSFAK
jgi:hypothetical protein